MRDIYHKAAQLLPLLLLMTIPAQYSRAQKNPIRIAAAADLQSVMPELAQQFKAQSGTDVEVAYGSSGNFFSQIQNGAPFDLFFSADLDYPQKLDGSGFCVPGTLFTYAVGRLVLWAPSGSPLALQNQGWKALLDPRVQKIAIANPEHAPYGQAAIVALEKAGIYDRVRSKLVFGENISQAAQFVQSGNAQAGLLALSLALSPAMQSGQRWLIPQNFYPPMNQGAVVLKSSQEKEAALAFLQFVKSPAGRAILGKWGFLSPQESRLKNSPTKSARASLRRGAACCALSDWQRRHSELACVSRRSEESLLNPNVAGLAGFLERCRIEFLNELLRSI